MTIREATRSDNSELLRLVRETPMNGTIQLRIDRDPDFFRLVSLRGKGKTFVATDAKGLIGCFSITEKDAFVNGSESSVGYLADLRIQPSARGRVATYRMAKASLAYASDAGSDHFCMVVAEGNDEMTSMVTGRAGLPKLQNLGVFDVYSILPRRTSKNPTGYSISRIDDLSTAKEAASFINDKNSEYLFAPVVHPADLTGLNSDRDLKEISYIARFDGLIVAAATSSDPSSAKSNTVLGVPWYLRISLVFLRFLKRFLPVSLMPQIGEPIRILFVRNFAVDQEHNSALRAILSEIRKDAYLNDYSFVSIGVHENDSRRSIFKGMLRFNFRSILYLIPSSTDPVDTTLGKEVPMVDFALG